MLANRSDRVILQRFRINGKGLLLGSFRDGDYRNTEGSSVKIATLANGLFDFIENFLWLSYVLLLSAFYDDEVTFSTSPGLSFYMAWRKLLNPFKWVEFLLGLGLLLCDHLVALTLVIVMHLNPFYWVGVAALHNDSDGTAVASVPTRAAGLCYFILAHIPILVLAQIYVVANDILRFALNCLLCPVNTIFRPLLEMAHDGEGLRVAGAVCLGLVLSALVVLAVLVSAGSIMLPLSLMATLPAIQPVVTALAVVVQPVLGIMAAGLSFMGATVASVASQVLLAGALSLLSFGTMRSLWKGDLWETIWMRLQFFAKSFNTYKCSDDLLEYSSNEQAAGYSYLKLLGKIYDFTGETVHPNSYLHAAPLMCNLGPSTKFITAQEKEKMSCLESFVSGARQSVGLHEFKSPSP